MTPSVIQLNARKELLRRGIWQLIDQGETLEALLIRLIDNVEGQADKMLAAVFLYDPTKNDLTIGAAPNLQPAYKKAVNGFKCGPRQPACGSAVFKRQQVICDDVKTDPLWEQLREFAEAIGIRAVWSQPIISEDGPVLGTVAFYHPEPKSPDSSDLIILETTASIAAVVIQARMDQAKALINAEAAAKEPRHQCFIYDGPPSHQLPMIASLVRQKLKKGYRCLYLNSPAMVAGLRSSLSAMGVDVAREVTERRLLLSSDSSDSFDIDEMLRLIEDALLKSIEDGFKGLWASGDMTWEFGAEKNFAKLLEYEHRLEQIFRSNEGLYGICQYHKGSFPMDALRNGFLSHQYLFINETISRTNPHHLDRKATDDELDEAITALTKGQ